MNTTRRMDGPSTEGRSGPHTTEMLVQSHLLEHPKLRFSDLRVHRGPNGICLEGFVETCDQDVDIAAVVREIVGAVPVLNRLHCGCRIPAPHERKGPTGAERIE